jgi:hypothetical protein
MFYFDKILYFHVVRPISPANLKNLHVKSANKIGNSCFRYTAQNQKHSHLMQPAAQTIPQKQSVNTLLVFTLLITSF